VPAPQTDTPAEEDDSNAKNQGEVFSIYDACSGSARVHVFYVALALQGGGFASEATAAAAHKAGAETYVDMPAVDYDRRGCRSRAGDLALLM